MHLKADVLILSDRVGLSRHSTPQQFTRKHLFVTSIQILSICHDLTGVIFVFQDFPGSSCILQIAVVSSFDWKNNTSLSVSYMPNLILESGT